jgi:hypothetical protein
MTFVSIAALNVTLSYPPAHPQPTATIPITAYRPLCSRARHTHTRIFNQACDVFSPWPMELRVIRLRELPRILTYISPTFHLGVILLVMTPEP